MAMSVKVQGIPRDHGKPIWSVNFVQWWRPRQLMEDPRFRRADRSGYVDAVAVLSLEEARELADQFRGTSKLPKKAELDSYLRLQAPESCWVFVSVYED